MARIFSSLLAIILTATALSACTPTEDDSGNERTASAPSVVIDAEVDHSSSRVILPSSYYWLNDDEKLIIDTAFNAALTKCTQENLGINWQYSDLRRFQFDGYLMFDEYGPWTEDMATRFAYVSPQTEADMAANGVELEGGSEFPSSNPPEYPELSPEDDARIDAECLGIQEVQQFNTGRLISAEPAALAQLIPSDIEVRIKKDKRGKAIFEDLKVCYSENGIAFKDSGSADPNPVWVSGANPDALNEEQIQLALKDVACKTEINMIPRIAELWAEFEAPIIEENAAELQAYREKIDETLTKAKEYLAENEHYLGEW